MLTITGTSFPNVSEEVTISMGVRRCEVQTASSTEITCVVPNNPPGEVNVVVDTQTKGENFREGYQGSYSIVLQDCTTFSETCQNWQRLSICI